MVWVLEAKIEGFPWRMLLEYHDKAKADRMADALRKQPHYDDVRVVEVPALEPQ